MSRGGRLRVLATGTLYPQPGGYPPNRLVQKAFRKVRLCMIGEGDGFRWGLTTGSRSIWKTGYALFAPMGPSEPGAGVSGVRTTEWLSSVSPALPDASRPDEDVCIRGQTVRDRPPEGALPTPALPALVDGPKQHPVCEELSQEIHNVFGDSSCGLFGSQGRVVRIDVVVGHILDQYRGLVAVIVN